jgi:hypothetical protein
MRQELLSKELVSLDYRTRLQQDLESAKIIRFLIGYVSGEGLDTINRGLLTNALNNELSFGVSSLTCSCGYKPLLDLQAKLGVSALSPHLVSPNGM